MTEYRAILTEGDKRTGVIVYHWVTPTIMHITKLIALTANASKWFFQLIAQLPWTTLLYRRRRNGVWKHWWRINHERITGRTIQNP